MGGFRMIARPAAVTAQRRKFVNRFLQALLIVGAAFVWHSGARANALVDQPYVVGYGDRLATAVFIDGKGPITLLLDTASSRTILYKRASIQAGLQPLPGERVTVYGLAPVCLKAPAIRLQELRISDEQVDGLTVAALPNPSTEDTAVDGILGLDVLERYCVVLDRTQQRLRLFPRAAGPPMPYSAWPSVPLLPRSVTAFPFRSLVHRRSIFQVQPGCRADHRLVRLGAGVTIINWQTAHRFNLRKWGLAAQQPGKFRMASASAPLWHVCQGCGSASEAVTGSTKMSSSPIRRFSIFSHSMTNRQPSSAPAS